MDGTNSSKNNRSKTGVISPSGFYKIPQRNPSPNHVDVARGADMVLVRIIGMGNMVTAPALADFLDVQVREGYRKYVFDLVSCRGLDSTFMGCMVGLLGLVARESEGSDHLLTTHPCVGEADWESKIEGKEAMDGPLSPDEALKLLQAQFGPLKAPEFPRTKEVGFVVSVNVSPECREMMEILGVDRFIRIMGQVDLNQIETARLPEKDLTPEERRTLILRAHENLVEIDHRNEEKFGAFLRALSLELSRQTGQT